MFTRNLQKQPEAAANSPLPSLHLPARIVIPTTHQIIWLEGLKLRTRLRLNYATVSGDFRPITISEDYHKFVSGPLTAFAESGPYELTLSASVDSGRSWELPVLIAHLLLAQEKLRFRSNGEENNKDAESQPPENLIWATGMVDPELRPIAGDYSIRRKLELSEPIFDDILAKGGHVSLILSADLPETDLAQARRLAERKGIDFFAIHDFGALNKVLGTSETVISEDQPRLSLADALRSRSGYFAMTTIAFLIIAAVVFTNYPSDPSIRELNRTAFRTGAQMNNLSIQGLYAADRAACVQSIWQGLALDTRQLPIAADRIAIKPEDGLCGLRLRNVGETPIGLIVANSLTAFAIGGDNPIFDGMNLAPSNSIDLFFRAAPQDLSAPLRIYTGPDQLIELHLDFSNDVSPLPVEDKSDG